MAKPPVHVTVTGAAGQIGYALLFRIASGQLLGDDQPVVLRMLEIEPAMGAVEGVCMELDDCAFPLLAGMEPTASLDVAFAGSSWCLLVGSIPRKAGMERGDLLNVNGGIFGPQGQSINKHAASDVRILVVGNPCNTNCLIARSHAPNVPVELVTNLAIWGNHSATQFPDYANARVDGVPAPDVIKDDAWLQGEFLETVQKRGAKVIEARGASSAASAANAAIDAVNSVWRPTADGQFHSLAVASRGEYGAPDGLQFGFPVQSTGDTWRVVEGL